MSELPPCPNAVFRRARRIKNSLTVSGARWCLGKGAASRFDGFMLEARSLPEAVMPEVLRQNAPQVAHDSLRSAGLSLDEIALVRKLMWPHLRDASLAGWKSDPRRQRARQRLHLYKHMGIARLNRAADVAVQQPLAPRRTTAPTGTAPLIRRGPGCSEIRRPQCVWIVWLALVMGAGVPSTEPPHQPPPWLIGTLSFVVEGRARPSA